MDYKIMQMPPFKVIGFEREFENETSYAKIPEFWDEFSEKYANSSYKKAIENNCIGEYGVCIDDVGGGRFRYIIAGKYTGGEVPEGMTLYEFPQSDWAIFECTGALPDALQSVNTRIFREWLPGNPDYEMSVNASVEWYDCTMDMNDENYKSAIWIPVRRKK